MAEILVIDDEPRLREFVRAALEDGGYTVREAEDGEAGLRAFRKRAADLVICDLFMPEREGFETIGELRRLAPGLAIIAMTGGSVHCAPEQLLRASRALGAKVTLTKPFLAADLLAAVEDALK
jgi:two-component system, chemotaxis family, chemotaxis protein CheY